MFVAKYILNASRASNIAYKVNKGLRIQVCLVLLVFVHIAWAKIQLGAKLH